MIAAAGLLGTAGLAAQEGARLGHAGWLAGCWELRAPGRVTLEMWMPPGGDLMVGASRTISGTAVSEFEQVRIRAEGGRLVYTALPSGQKEASFPSTHTSDTMLVFENLGHDFPQRIIYRRRGADSIVARIEGPGSNNTTRGINFPMRRTSCTAPAAPPDPPETQTVDAAPSPTGDRLLLVRTAGPNWDIFLTAPDGAEILKLTDHPRVDYQPAWSPDARLIAFTSNREGHQEIYTVRPDGSGLSQLTRGTAHNSEPAWSPDGKRIAFRSERDGSPQVYVMNADGSDPRALTSGTNGGSVPAWSPDGRQIAFTSVRGGRPEVYLMRADGSIQTRLTTTAEGNSGLPAWSPDGKRIAFWTTRDGNAEVYIMDADGLNPVNASRNAAMDVLIGWTADGTHLLFRSNRERRGFDIYRMKPDGTDVTRVTNTR
jgi:Tol biopolymer transport system component